MIALPPNDDHTFVYIPRGFDQAYLEGALSRALGQSIIISSCRVTNLCAWQDGGVSNSGATVLRLSLDLADGTSFDVKAKILSPDAVNLFKPDCRFDARLSEIAWARWWGEQDVSFVPIVYDTRADITAREFWTLEEYFPQVGWPGYRAETPKGMGHFSADMSRLRALFEQVAVLHAHSRVKMHELRPLFSGSGIRPGHLCTPSMLLDALTCLLEDTSLLSTINIMEEKRRLLDTYRQTIARRPSWVDEWDVVCVTADWGPDNFGMRDPERASELVTFDWGTTRLAPMEGDLWILLGRLELDEETQGTLVHHYLQCYADRTGRPIDDSAFMARIPWARFLVHLRYIAEHANNLRWVRYQTRSADMIHLFIHLLESAELPAR
jgi:hypothetical protein